MIEKFKEVFETRHELVREEKDQGKKVIGWVCTYVPEEIIYAAGMYPIRILGGGKGDTSIADAHLYSNICTFARSCLEEGFRGRYDFLDGFIAVNSCDHIRRLYDVWKGYQKTPFAHIISLPHKVSPSAIAFFHNQLLKLTELIENKFGITISREALQQAIEVYNKNRALLKSLYELRKVDAPPISGAEVMDVILAGMVIPKDRHNQMLEDLLRWLINRDHIIKGKARLLVSGSELDEPDYLETIEGLGGVVVTDDLCNGTRYFWDPIEIDGDPLESIAKRYLTRSPCARMRPSNQRVNFLKDMIRDFRVEGVICETIKFCDPYGEDLPIIKEALEGIGVPMLSLDREYGSSGAGQVKTRVQAFLEQLEG
jgi:bzd-type benzoyl-CoA reductase N subunit